MIFRWTMAILGWYSISSRLNVPHNRRHYLDQPWVWVTGWVLEWEKVGRRRWLCREKSCWRPSQELKQALSQVPAWRWWYILLYYYHIIIILLCYVMLCYIIYYIALHYIILCNTRLCRVCLFVCLSVRLCFFLTALCLLFIALYFYLRGE